MGTWTTTPTTATAGAAITAALWNSDVRDFGNAFGAWTSYTPTLGGFTLGSGTMAGVYLQVQKLVIFRASFTYGSGSAAASASPTFTLPVTAASAYAQATLQAWYYDSSVPRNYPAYPLLASTTTVAVRMIDTGGGNYPYATVPSTSTPFTWATGDQVIVGGVYEAD